MPGGRPEYNRAYILPKYNFLAEFPVEQKNKVNFRMQSSYPFQRLKGKPANTIKLTWH